MIMRTFESVRNTVHF